jgi:hypothetical protein
MGSKAVQSPVQDPSGLSQPTQQSPSRRQGLSRFQRFNLRVSGRELYQTRPLLASGVDLSHVRPPKQRTGSQRVQFRRGSARNFTLKPSDANLSAVPEEIPAGEAPTIMITGIILRGRGRWSEVDGKSLKCTRAIAADGNPAARTRYDRFQSLQNLSKSLF